MLAYWLLAALISGLVAAMFDREVWIKRSLIAEAVLMMLTHLNAIMIPHPV
jgi:hypothetical protein